MRLIALLFAVLLTGCAPRAIVEQGSVAQSLPTPTPSYPQIEPYKVTDFTVISVTLEAAAYGSGNGETFDQRATGNWFLVRRKTIHPDELPSGASIPDDLRANFVAENMTSEVLREDGYDVKFGVEMTNKTSAPDFLFNDEDKRKKKKHGNMDLKAVISLSRVGFDSTHSRSLVFVEFYNPTIGMQKKFALIKWKREGIGIMTDGIEWFD